MTQEQWKKLRDGVEQWFSGDVDEAIAEHNEKREREVYWGSPPVSGFVYLLRDRDRFKIGRSKNVKSRLQQIKSLEGKQIELVCSMYSDDYHWLEQRLHTKFWEKSVGGEWFRLGPEDVEYIKGLADG